MEVREASAGYTGLTELPGEAVPSGYKQTEAGVIPEDWEVRTLRQISPSQSVGLVINPSTYYVSDGTVPMLVGSNVKANHIDWESARRISDSSNRLISASRLAAGDLVTVRVGEPGTTAVVPPEIDGCNCASMMIVRKGAGFDSRWLCYVMNSWLGLRQVEHVQYGTAQKQFNISDAVHFAYPSPRLNEQTAIAEALSDADALIESLEQLIAKKRQIKQGTMQALLTGRQRLPGFSEDWVVRSLSDLASIRSGGTPSTAQAQFWDGDILWCTPTDITALNGRKYLSDTVRKITWQGLQSSSAELIEANSIVMTSRATIGECAINVLPVATNQGFKNFIPFDDVDVEFFYYLLLTQKEGFIRLCAGSTFLEIGKTQLASFEVLMPTTTEEQTAIATILTDMDAELAELETRLAKTRQLKQGMMQELLTGRIRLVQPALNVVPLLEKKETRAAAASPHNRQINEAVVIAALVKQFGSEDWPLARVRRTKLTYLLHRHAEGRADGFLKKAAGPYDPRTRYKGPEGIALKKGYVQALHNGTYEGFVASEHISEAETYFEKWYGTDVMDWLERFRLRKTDELELLTTVDMAMEDLRREGKPISVEAVRQLIHGHPEWKPKLERAIFSDDGIAAAIAECQALFAS